MNNAELNQLFQHVATKIVSAEISHGPGPRGASVQEATGQRPPEPRGTLSVGRIAKLFVGQGYGFIRTANTREIFFHRTDLREGTSINNLRISDRVIFELLEDHVSGARALRVAQQGHR